MTEKTSEPLLPSYDTSTDLPDAHELEVSIFGAGYGEAIVIHVGDGRWIAIDSLGSSSRSITRDYLEALGVDIASQLDLIVATHWHDDHIRGIADLFEASVAAEFVFPQAMLKDEFIRFAAAFQGQSSKSFSSGVDEFGKVIEIAEKRMLPNTKWPLRFSADGYVAYRKGVGTLSHGQVVSFEALSPSHFDVAAFLARVSGVTPQPRVMRRAPTYGRNDVSSAFFLLIGEDAVLLGADVENGTHVNSGWNAILSSSTLPDVKAKLVKVPHHGGLSGHHASMWTNLASAEPIATLTPWAKGRGKLPTPSDIARIAGLACSSFSTGPSASEKEVTQPSIVAKVLAKDKIKLTRVGTALGHVRHRATITGGPLVWRTELFGRACVLEAMAA